MDILHNFAGVPVKPYCTTYRSTPVWIDRVRVVAVRTMLHEILFFVEGSHGSCNQWYPLTRQVRDPAQALDALDVLEGALQAARQDEQERREKDKQV